MTKDGGPVEAAGTVLGLEYSPGVPGLHGGPRLRGFETLYP